MQFQQDWPKDKKLQLFQFFGEKLEKFRSTEHYAAPLEGSTIFLNRSSTCRMSMESYRVAELKYAIFSRTGRKTKKLQRLSLFPWTVFNPIQARLFLILWGQVAQCAPFWKPCSFCSNSLLLRFFWKLVQSLITWHTLVSMATMSSVFLRWLKAFFLQKPQTKDIVQMALFLVLNEGTNAKLDVCTYLRLTLNGNYVGWA